MLAELGIVVIALGCAYAMGVALNQGSTCAVTAARELVDHRSPRMTIGFMLAVAAAGLVWLPLAWSGAGQVSLSGGVPIAWSLIVGAMLLGFGAVINDACLLGTLSRIGHGEVRFFALPVGLGIGFALADRLHPDAGTVPMINLLGRPSPASGAVLIAFMVAIAVGAFLMIRGGDRGDLRRWPLWFAMLVLGVSGAALFALAPGWTYADFLRRGVAMEGGMTIMAGAAAVSAALAMVAGAISAGVVGRTFRYRPPRFGGVMRSIAGGAVMAVGATLVPGGNDAVLLAELPALTASGIAGFAVMSGTVLGLLLLLRRRLSRPRPVAA